MAKVYTSEYIEVFTHTGEGIALVPKLELTITTTGEPVHLMLQPQSV